MDEYRRRSMSYYIDVPRLVLKPITDSSMYTSDTVYIAPGSRFLFLSFLYSDQCFYNETSKRTLSAKFLWPPRYDFCWPVSTLCNSS